MPCTPMADLRKAAVGMERGLAWGRIAPARSRLAWTPRPVSIGEMSIGTPFHERTAPLNVKQQWREWSGYFAASAYDHVHIHEYTAIRNSAALIDVSPLYKYVVRGPDAVSLVDRVITRDATKIKRGQVIYTPWCDEHGKVIDDGTVARLDDDSFRWTTAEAHLRWFGLNARGLDVEIEDVSEQIAAIALQGPLARAVLEAATGEPWTDLAYHHRRHGRIAGIELDVSRTGYTGDLGYELWVSAGAGRGALGSAGRGRARRTQSARRACWRST